MRTWRLPPTESDLMDPRDTITDYYRALRDEDPLGPYFADETAADDQYVKFGLSERLEGAGAIRDGLRYQSETTEDWSIESHALRVSDRETTAWFSDRVTMSWTDTGDGSRLSFETRWSGTLERRDSPGDVDGDGTADDTHDADGGPSPWQFVGMHVSTATDR